MIVKTNNQINKGAQWLSAPEPGHLVQFYPYEHALLSSLEEYISAGLKKSETCIVIATGRHLQDIDERLKSLGIDTMFARAQGQYITFDAAETLASFMISGLPDRERFLKIVGTVVAKAANRGMPVRAYGEMVALLWKKDNLAGVIQLEKLWNELLEVYPFSLYCAYPQMYFDKETHGEELNEIRHCHTLATADF